VRESELVDVDVLRPREREHYRSDHIVDGQQ
jgi:hypothetical protein